MHTWWGFFFLFGFWFSVSDIFVVSYYSILFCFNLYKMVKAGTVLWLSSAVMCSSAIWFLLITILLWLEFFFFLSWFRHEYELPQSEDWIWVFNILAKIHRKGHFSLSAGAVSCCSCQGCHSRRVFHKASRIIFFIDPKRKNILAALQTPITAYFWVCENDKNS